MAQAEREERLMAALRDQPGGQELLKLADDGGELSLIGGAVRDLLVDRMPRELDVVLSGDSEAPARKLAELLGGEVSVHQRFGTAAVQWPGGRIDLAMRRAETYAAPGALPDVRPGSFEEDLQRRDFTVNAIALPLQGDRRGELAAVPGALEDLAEGRLRVLHERSFLDDPTRLLRLCRYAARLRFQIEPATEQLATSAIAGGALESVSGARIGAELKLALAESDALLCLRHLDQLGALAALGLTSPLRRELLEAALALLPSDGSPGELIMSGLSPSRELLDAYEYHASERDRIVSNASLAPSLAESLTAAGRPSELHRALAKAPPEAVALAGAVSAAQGRSAGRDAAREWLATLRHVKLSIRGDDLLQAGVPAGPEIGRRLTAALALRLDGEIGEGSEAELAAALEAEP